MRPSDPHFYSDLLAAVATIAGELFITNPLPDLTVDKVEVKHDRPPEMRFSYHVNDGRSHGTGQPVIMFKDRCPLNFHPIFAYDSSLIPRETQHLQGTKRIIFGSFSVQNFA